MPIEDNKERKNKTLMSLILPEFILGIGKVLTFGATKYYPYSWKKVTNPIDTYIDALDRHILAFKTGNIYDDETKLHHLFHAATNLMFIWWHSKYNVNAYKEYRARQYKI